MNKELTIGDLKARIPVIQGGMGVGISLSGLAGAVAKAGGVGVISAAQIGFRRPDYEKDPLSANLEAIGEEIARARELADGGIIGINIMVATTDYELYVKKAVEAGVDLVISGAGLPMNLPELVRGSSTKLAPIVSSLKATSIIFRQWQRKYERLPDLVVIEGPLAGGHLGFSREEVQGYKKEDYDKEIQAILDFVTEVSQTNGIQIPVVVGGGITKAEDLIFYRKMGASGVQIGSRFVTTLECDAHENYKKAYLEAREEDIVITISPVGMPGRAIRNAFLKRVEAGERIMGPCRHCVKSCNPATTPYCIGQALINAARGRVEEGLIFCGGRVYGQDKIQSVESIMKEFDLCQ